MDISPKQFMEAIDQIAEEKNIPKERILETVEAALAAAYRKDFGNPEQHVRVKLHPDTGKSEVSVVFDVVGEIENEHTEVTVAEAKKRGLKRAKVGDELVEKVKPPADYGRIAAQTAKQVIIQKIREVEREIVKEEFAEKAGELMTGAVQRIEGRNVFVEIGRAIGVLGPGDQIEHERYYIGQRLRVLLREVDSEARGAQLILTRSHPDFVRRLFELEVPEIHAGTVETKSIAREAGVRTKVAVFSNQEGVDPVGTCVGQRGTRVQAIMAELGEEKIDIVLYDEDVKTYIMNALSPAKISRIELDEEHQTANIIVADDQLSLAIGRGGQNVRLAGELAGWQLDIDKTDQQKQQSEGVVAGIPLAEIDGVEQETAEAFAKAGLKTAQQVAAALPEDLESVENVDDDDKQQVAQRAAKAVAESGDHAEDELEAELEESKKVTETAVAGTEEAPVPPKKEKEKALADKETPEKSDEAAEKNRDQGKPVEKPAQAPSGTDDKPVGSQAEPGEPTQEKAAKAEGDDKPAPSADADQPAADDGAPKSPTG